MLKFGNEMYLWILVIIPILILLFYINLIITKKYKLKITTELWERITNNLSSWKHHFKFYLIIISVLLLIVAIANPLRGTKLEEVKQEGVDIFIAIDVSLSMLAEDVAPNRIEKSKFEINKLIDKLSGDRIGIISFSGTSFVQLPITSDYSAAKMFVDVISTESNPTPGSDLENAITLAEKSFYQDKPTTKVLIIITDGETTEGDALLSAKEAKNKGVFIYTIGVGSQSGSPIPIVDGYGRKDFKKDRNGNVVLTKLDEEGLLRIAEIGGGKYINTNNSSNALDEIFSEINKLQKREIGQKMFTEFETEYQYFGFAGLILILIEIFVSRKKTNWLNNFKFKN